MFISILLLIFYISCLSVEIFLLARCLKEKFKWSKILIIEIISIIISSILTVYYNDLPSSGFMLGLTYISHFLISLVSLITYIIMLLITIISILIKRNKKMLIVILILFFVGTIILFTCYWFKPLTKITGTVDLEDIVQPSMNINVEMTPNWYFFHNDKLFAYNYGINGEEFFCCNINAKSKNVITKSEEMRYANFFLVFNNEAYYYNEFKRGIKKVNLSTGEITTVVDNKYLYLIPDTLVDSTVMSVYENNYLNKSHVYIAELNLDTGVLNNEKKLNYTSNQVYFYYKQNNKTYYIKSDDNQNDTNNIYEDNKIIYSYSADMNSQSQNVLTNNVNDVVFVQNNYIFAVIGNKIIKFDINDYSILEEKELTENMKYNLISSVRPGGTRTLGMEESSPSICTNNNPMFNSTISKGIYKFNSDTLSFEKIIDTTGGFVQKYNDYYIFQSNTETIIYNNKTNNYKIYNSANYSIENGYIYMMTFTGDFYHQKYDDLKFKIEKVILSTI